MRNLLDIMFDFSNPGGKIKKYALIAYKIIVIIGGVMGTLMALYPLILLFDGSVPSEMKILLFLPAVILGIIIGAIIFFATLFGNWLSSIALYGFGQLIESSENSEGLLRRNDSKKADNKKEEREKEAEERARKEGEERARKEAEERARKEAEERARKEAEERALEENEAVIYEQYMDEIISSITFDTINNMDNYPEKVSSKFLNAIVAARLCNVNQQSRLYMESSMDSLEDPVELYIMKLLIELPDEEFRTTIKQICKKYGR